MNRYCKNCGETVVLDKNAYCPTCGTHSAKMGEQPVVEITKSFNEGIYSGNYTVHVFDDNIKSWTGKSWPELTDEEKREIITDYL
jgi:hypothetical protein